MYALPHEDWGNGLLLTSATTVDWADLITLDLSKFDEQGGKQRLAAQLKEAVHNVGFFYITGFGLDVSHDWKGMVTGIADFVLSKKPWTVNLPSAKKSLPYPWKRS